VGGRCVHASTSKRGYIMGMSIEGAATMKVQWDDGDSTSRLVHSQLVHCSNSAREGTPWYRNRT
jgi:hypothetical protein